jgi:hypothetical protein
MWINSVWVGKTDTYDAGDLKQLVASYADAVVDGLKDKGLIISSL